jgi:WD repeat-containing protein 61
MTYAPKCSLADAHEDGIWSVAWSANGQLITGSCDEVCSTFTCMGAELQPKHTLKGHALGITSVSCSVAGGLAASSALDSHIRIWDLEIGTELRSIDAGPVEAWTVAMTPDGKHVVSGSQSGNLNVWSGTSDRG